MTRTDDVADRIDQGLPRNGWTDLEPIHYTPYTPPTAPAPTPAPTPVLTVPEPAPAPAPQVAHQVVSPEGVTSIPIYTEQICNVYFTIILVNVPGTRTQYQIYAVDTERDWGLIGLVGLYQDALAELQSWNKYLSNGGTYAAWQKANPDGIMPLFRKGP